MQYGRAEIHRRRQKLEATFAAIDGAGLSGELTAHYARYLCVLVSGHAEQSVKTLVSQYCKKRASGEVQRYVGRQLKWVRNLKVENLKQLIEAFDPDWWAQVAETDADDLLAFDSVVTDRNAIVHGNEAGITVERVRQYLRQISKVLDDLSDFFDPKPAA
jgi:hypothetical protein